MNRFLAVLLITLVVAGCATTTSQKTLEKPPQHAARVKILMYDGSPRTKSDHFEVFSEIHLVQKPYKEIALLTCDGTVNEESVMTEAIIYRARMLGADAVIILD